jgi:hypothetical protein
MDSVFPMSRADMGDREKQPQILHSANPMTNLRCSRGPKRAPFRMTLYGDVEGSGRQRASLLGFVVFPSSRLSMFLIP